ncbi:Periplasmic sensor domain-like [Trinorchestia longiramus]|nr:Periplasmic sensor domain-like [Trinorchestia longiramus]
MRYVMQLAVIVLLVLGSSNGVMDNQYENKFSVEWSNLYKYLLDVAYSGLQAGKIQDDLNENYEWTHDTVDGPAILEKKIETFADIIHSNLASVWQLRDSILQNFDFSQTPAPVIPRERNCCFAAELHPEGCFKTPQANETGLAFRTNAQIMNQLSLNNELYTQVLLQHLTLYDGSMLLYPAKPTAEIASCTTYDPRRRYWYVEVEAPYPRDVVLLVDEASPAPPELLLLALNRVLDCITSSDRIVVAPSADIAEHGWRRGDWWAGELRAGLGVWVDGHELLKEKLMYLIETEVASLTRRFASHVDALHWAQYLLYAKPIYPLKVKRDAVDIVVLVTNRPGWGSWRDNEELSNNVHNLIEENATLIVLALPGADDALAEGEPSPTYQAALHVTTISNESQLNRANLARYFTSPDFEENAFESDSPNRAVITLPYFDAFGANLVMTICLPIKLNGSFWGSACNDISVVNLFERLISVPGVNDGYAFVMDGYGRSMMHPLVPSPSKLKDHPLFIQMTELEQHNEAQLILQHMIDRQTGSKIVDGKLIRNVGRPFQIALPNAVSRVKIPLLYSYGVIKWAPISMAVVLPLQDSKTTKVSYTCKTEQLCQSPHFQYHRLDLEEKKPPTCRYFGKEAVKSNAVIKLAPSCFRDVLSYIKHEDNRTVAQLYDIFKHNHAMANFLWGSELREDVALGERVEEYWKTAADWRPCVGTRFLATQRGVLALYPGSQLPNQAYDPRQRPWYRGAVESASTTPVVVVSPPYCDILGAGLIVTASMALTSPIDPNTVVAVVAGDFSSHSMTDNFVQLLPQCAGRFSCFLIDKSGYVVVHTKWQNKPPVHPTDCEVPEHGAHVNMVEPAIGLKLVEIDILKRQACFDYEESDLFQYWTVELPLSRTQVITDDFAINHIPFSNLFLVVYEPSADKARGCVCPKSWMIGRPFKCRNTCTDFCECPCVAAPNTERCRLNARDILRKKVPPCWPKVSVNEIHPTSFDAHLKELPPCSFSNCTVSARRSS